MITTFSGLSRRTVAFCSCRLGSLGSMGAPVMPAFSRTMAFISSTAILGYIAADERSSRMRYAASNTLYNELSASAFTMASELNATLAGLMGRCSSVPRAPRNTSARITKDAMGRFHHAMKESRERVGKNLTASHAARTSTTNAASSTPL